MNLHLCYIHIHIFSFDVILFTCCTRNMKDIFWCQPTVLKNRGLRYLRAFQSFLLNIFVWLNWYCWTLLAVNDPFWSSEWNIDKGFHHEYFNLSTELTTGRPLLVKTWVEQQHYQSFLVWNWVLKCHPCPPILLQWCHLKDPLKVHPLWIPVQKLAKLVCGVFNFPPTKPGLHFEMYPSRRNRIHYWYATSETGIGAGGLGGWVLRGI